MKQLKEEFSEPQRLPRSAYALEQYSRKFCNSDYKPVCQGLNPTERAASVISTVILQQVEKRPCRK